MRKRSPLPCSPMDLLAGCKTAAFFWMNYPRNKLRFLTRHIKRTPPAFKHTERKSNPTASIIKGPATAPSPRNTSRFKRCRRGVLHRCPGIRTPLTRLWIRKSFLPQNSRKCKRFAKIYPLTPSGTKTGTAAQSQQPQSRAPAKGSFSSASPLFVGKPHLIFFRIVHAREKAPQHRLRVVAGVLQQAVRDGVRLRRFL